MPHFVLTCFDKQGALDLRMATRPAHLEYIDGAMDFVRLAAPMLDDDGQVIGSLLILECDRARAEAFAANDPYQVAGVFERVELREIKITRGELR